MNLQEVENLGPNAARIILNELVDGLWDFILSKGFGFTYVNLNSDYLYFSYQHGISDKRLGIRNFKLHDSTKSDYHLFLAEELQMNITNQMAINVPVEILAGKWEGSIGFLMGSRISFGQKHIPKCLNNPGRIVYTTRLSKRNMRLVPGSERKIEYKPKPSETIFLDNFGNQLEKGRAVLIYYGRFMQFNQGVIRDFDYISQRIIVDFISDTGILTTSLPRSTKIVDLESISVKDLKDQILLNKLSNSGY